MSMLTAQVEILRDRAHELCMLADGLSAPYVIPSTKETMFLAMKSAASEMRDAADTIESLREKAQDNITERDKVYNAGFDNGVKACLQQLEGKLVGHCGITEIEEWIDKQWREYES